MVLRWTPSRAASAVALMRVVRVPLRRDAATWARRTARPRPSSGKLARVSRIWAVACGFGVAAFWRTDTRDSPADRQQHPLTGLAVQRETSRVLWVCRSLSTHSLRGCLFRADRPDSLSDPPPGGSFVFGDRCQGGRGGCALGHDGDLPGPKHTGAYGDALPCPSSLPSRARYFRSPDATKPAFAGFGRVCMSGRSRRTRPSGRPRLGYIELEAGDRHSCTESGWWVCVTTLYRELV